MPKRLKYRIREKLQRVPAAEYAQHKAALIKKLGVSRPHFYKLIAIPADSSSSITTDQLLVFADHFDCTVDELINKKALV